MPVDPEDPKVLTEFGAAVLALMYTRGVRHQVELASLLEDPQGRRVGKNSMSCWLRGVHSPPDWLPRELARALELDEDQRIRLAMAFSFGSDLKLGAFRELGVPPAN